MSDSVFNVLPEPIGTIGEPTVPDPDCPHPAPLKGLEIIDWRDVLFCPSCESIIPKPDD